MVDIIESVSNTLSLTQSQNLEFIVSLSDSLSLTQNQNLELLIGLGNTLSLTQNQNLELSIGLSNAINLTQADDESETIYNTTLIDYLRSIENFDPTDPLSSEILGLRDILQYEQSIINISLEDFLQIAQMGENVKPESLTQILNLTQELKQVEFEQLVQYIYLTQQAIIDFVTPASNILNLSQQLDVVHVRQFSLGNALSLQDSGDYYNYISCVNPQQGGGIILEYPYDTPQLSVQLPSPNYGDSESLEFSRINRQTRGGDLKIFRDPAWGEATRVTYNIGNIKEKYRNDLLNFLNLTLGLEVKIIDFKGNTWKGIILNPESLVSEDNTDSDISLQFEGEKQ